jgi:hypothetical protein
MPWVSGEKKAGGREEAMRRAGRQANAERPEKKTSSGRGRFEARRLVGIAAILWMAAGACGQQRPLATVQTEARIIQMAGEAVARRAEKKKQSGGSAAWQAASGGSGKIRREPQGAGVAAERSRKGFERDGE